MHERTDMVSSMITVTKQLQLNAEDNNIMYRSTQPPHDQKQK